MRILSIVVLLFIINTACSHGGLLQHHRWEGIVVDIMQVHVAVAIPADFTPQDVIKKMDRMLYKQARKRALFLLDNYVVVSKPQISSLQYNSLRLHTYNVLKKSNKLDSYCHQDYCEAIYEYNINTFLKQLHLLQ